MLEAKIEEDPLENLLPRISAFFSRLTQNHKQKKWKQSLP